MASRLVSLLVVAAICAVALQSATAKQIYGNDNWIQNSAVQSIMQKLVPNKDISTSVDGKTAIKYLNLASCFNGTFSQLKEKSSHLTEEPLYKACQENKDNLLEAYMVGWGYLTGSAICVPVHFLKEFEHFVAIENLDENKVEKNLLLFPGTWEIQSRLFQYNEYCERMIDLVDDELAQWGYDSQQVVDFFASRTKLPVGKALELCRKRIEV